MNTKILTPVKSYCRCPQSCINHRACDRPDFSRFSKYCCVYKHVRLDLIEVPRLDPLSGLISSSTCGTAMIHRGSVYWCIQSARGGCHRSIRSAEISKLVEEAMLATFELFLLNPTKRQATGGDLTVRVGLAATLDADRERLAQLNDDHYDGLIDKVVWVRQRARVAETIEVTRRAQLAPCGTRRQEPGRNASRRG